jgi:leucyl aminopeptidase
MDIAIKQDNPLTHKTQVLIAGVFTNRRLSPTAERIDRRTQGLITRVMKNGDIKGGAGQTLVLHHPSGLAAERLVLVGFGAKTSLKAHDFFKSLDAAARAVAKLPIRNATSCLAEIEVAGLSALRNIEHQILAFDRAAYRFERMKSRAENRHPVLTRLTCHAGEGLSADEGKAAVAAAQAVAGAVRLARDLGNLPPNECTPAYLAEQAQALGTRQRTIKVNVLEQDDMEKLGMGALLSVARGSRQPPKLIVMQYGGGEPGQKPIVLVGKGVTFDSGGISIKPAQAMDEMKFDMCGAASVIGSLQAAAELQLPLNVVGVVPATENLPDGNAAKPSDIVKTMSGQTVEILNTDAEGRLILCDALTYCKQFHPAVVVDIATLTGACVVALGHHASGLMTNDEELAGQLLHAGEDSYDRAWRLPLWDDYQKELDSNFADFANVGGRSAGTITAACFLSRFTKDYRWAHIDIAGTAWYTGKEKGATGRPVPLLMSFLRSRARGQ